MYYLHTQGEEFRDTSRTGFPKYKGNYPADRVQRHRHAWKLLKEWGLDLETDFHALRSEMVETIRDQARRDVYRSTVRPNGSRARMYFAKIQRDAQPFAL